MCRQATFHRETVQAKVAVFENSYFKLNCRGNYKFVYVFRWSNFLQNQCCKILLPLLCFPILAKQSSSWNTHGKHPGKTSITILNVTSLWQRGQYEPHPPGLPLESMERNRAQVRRNWKWNRGITSQKFVFLYFDYTGSLGWLPMIQTTTPEIFQVGWDESQHKQFPKSTRISSMELLKEEPCMVERTVRLTSDGKPCQNTLVESRNSPVHS